jgi:hypothetical protein
MHIWLCDTCGVHFEEDGTGDGMGQALSHLANTSRAGDKHTIKGLVDMDTGEVLVAGMNPRKARLENYVVGKGGESRRDRLARGEKGAYGPPRTAGGDGTGGAGGAGGGAGKPAAGGAGGGRRTPPLDRERQKQTLSKATAFRVGGKVYEHPGTTNPPPGRIPTPVITTLQGWNLTLPPYIFGLFSVAIQVITRDDGRPYEWTPEGLNDFLWDTVRAHIEFIVPPLFVRASGGALNEHQVVRMLRRISGMSPEEITAAAQEAAEEVGEAAPVG